MSYGREANAGGLFLKSEFISNGAHPLSSSRTSNKEQKSYGTCKWICEDGGIFHPKLTCSFILSLVDMRELHVVSNAEYYIPRLPHPQKIPSNR